MTILQFKPTAARPSAADRVKMRAELVHSLECALVLADDLGMGFVGIDICQALERLDSGYPDSN